MARIKPRARRMRKLSELVLVMIRDQRCFFCNELLLDCKKPYRDMTPSYGTWLKIFDKPSMYLVTVHHENHKRTDNTGKNHKLCHRACHKKYHNLYDRLLRKQPTILPVVARRQIIQQAWIKKKEK